MKKKWYDDSFWHRDFIDLWTIPHTLFGTMPAFLCALLGYNMLIGFLVTIIIAIVWEIGETVVGVWSDEALSNKVSDIIIAGIGYDIIWGWIYFFQPEQELVYQIFLIVWMTLIVTSAIGWTGYYLWHKNN